MTWTVGANPVSSDAFFSPWCVQDAAAAALTGGAHRRRARGGAGSAWTRRTT
jgi:hypothetical protein